MPQISAPSSSITSLTVEVEKASSLGQKFVQAVGKLALCAVVAVMTACSTQGPLKPSSGTASEGAVKESAPETTAVKRIPKFGLALGGGAAHDHRWAQEPSPHTKKAPPKYTWVFNT